MVWLSVVDWNLFISAASPVLAVAVSWGVMNTRVLFLEKMIEELKAEVKDFRRLSEDLAVVKHDISSIKDMVVRIIKDVEK